MAVVTATTLQHAHHLHLTPVGLPMPAYPALFLQTESTSWHSSNCGEAVERMFTVRVVGERN